MNNDNKRYVSLTAFGIIMAVMVAVLGWLFLQLNSMQTQVNEGVAARNEINIQLTRIQKDVEWIRKAIENNNITIVR